MATEATPWAGFGVIIVAAVVAVLPSRWSPSSVASSAAEVASAGESISSNVVTVAGSASEATAAVDEVRRAEIALGGIADELGHLIGVDASTRQVGASLARTTDEAVRAT